MVMQAYWTSWSGIDKWANILTDLATSEKYKDDSWKYFDNDIWNFWTLHWESYNQEKVEKLIKISEEIINKY
jgi:hypothetical protein